MVIPRILTCFQEVKDFATCFYGFESAINPPAKPKTQTFRSGFGLAGLAEMNRRSNAREDFRS